MPGSSRPKFRTWWLYCHLMTYQVLHMSKRPRTLQKHLFSSPLCQLPASPTPPTQPTSRHLQQGEQGIPADSLWSPHPPEAFLGFYIVMFLNGEERKRQEMFSFFGEKPVSVLKRNQCRRLLQFTQLQCLPISFTQEDSPLSRKKAQEHGIAT